MHLYRQRADVENAYDELKNQWGWGGFTTRDLGRCQVARQVQDILSKLSLFLSGLTNAEEQLKSEERWRRIWHRILEPFRQQATALLGGSG